MMNDLHIEFSHIYQDEPFSNEHETSVLILKELLRNYQQNGQTVVTSILIDDYHSQEHVWSENELLDQVSSFGCQPDVLAFEGSFVKLASDLINELPEQFKRIEHFCKEKKCVVFFVDGQVKFSLLDQFAYEDVPKCVLLSCTWLLCKLGILPFPKDSFKRLNQEVDLSSRTILSILPESYRSVEENVYRLLLALGYENEIKRVQYIYF